MILDFEWSSELDIKRHGLYRMVKHPSTTILCWAYNFGMGGDTRVEYDPASADRVFLDILGDDSVLLHAHNAAVERLVIEEICGPRFGWPVPRRSRWRCSAARVGRLAVPRSLEKAAEALAVSVQKDVEGKKLMMKLAHPKATPQGWVYDRDPVKIARLGAYCATDVDAEMAVEAATFPLTPAEDQRYLLVERMNDRGVRIDVQLVQDLLGQAMQNGGDLNAELSEVTGGAVRRVTNVGALKKWIEAETGISLKTLRKEDVEQMDESAFRNFPRVARAIELRSLGGKSSVSKLRTILDRVDDDGMLRGAFVSFATSTGRLTSYGVQLHNLPRDTLPDYAMRTGRMHSEPLTVREISTAIRGVIIPEDGHVFVDADFNAIEARGVGWLAGCDMLTNLFRTGGDPYCHTATDIYGRTITKLDESERWVGKQTVLGCGYGMGPVKFVAQCLKLGRPVPDELAQRAVATYREEYREIPALWYGVEAAAIDAVNKPGRVTDFRNLEFRVRDGWLKMRLPSGRFLFYSNPKIKDQMTPWGEMRPKLTYMASNPVTKKWMREGTFGGHLVENACQAFCGDLLMSASIRLERRGIGLRLSVHDQVVVQAPRAQAEEVKRIVQEEMERGEDWSVGFPIKADPKIMERFGK